MRVNKVNFTGIKIYSKDNKDVKFLYNKVLDTVQKEKLPAVFKNDVVELPTSSKLKEILQKLGIRYKED